MIELIVFASGLLIGYAIYRAINKWQPMVTAPRDGRQIIILDKHGYEWLATYRDDIEEFVSGRGLLTGVWWREVTKFDEDL